MGRERRGTLSVPRVTDGSRPRLNSVRKNERVCDLSSGPPRPSKEEIGKRGRVFGLIRGPTETGWSTLEPSGSIPETPRTVQSPGEGVDGCPTTESLGVLHGIFPHMRDRVTRGYRREVREPDFCHVQTRSPVLRSGRPTTGESEGKDRGPTSGLGEGIGQSSATPPLLVYRYFRQSDPERGLTNREHSLI